MKKKKKEEEEEEDNDDEGISLPSTPSVLQRNGFKIEHSQKEKNGDDESIDSNSHSHSQQQQQQRNDKSISPIITDFESIIATNSIPINSS